MDSSFLCSPIPECTKSFSSHTGRLLKSRNIGRPESVINFSYPASFPRHVKWFLCCVFQTPWLWIFTHGELFLSQHHGFWQVPAGWAATLLFVPTLPLLLDGGYSLVRKVLSVSSESMFTCLSRWRKGGRCVCWRVRYDHFSRWISPPCNSPSAFGLRIALACLNS